MTGKRLQAVALACALVSLLCFAVPAYIVRPFRPQGPHEFPFAMAVRESGPLVSAVCVLIAFGVLVSTWRSARMLARTALTMSVLLAVAGAALTRINVFELMFHPYGSADFASAKSVPLDDRDMVMSLTVGSDTHAYPVRAMGYHHVVNDTVGGVPVVATYCTLCHTGIVWKRVVGGRALTFRLGGIRNGNALLRDEETGSIWQQTTGIAIFGPLNGSHLDPMPADELSYALWRTERPGGQILKPNPQFAAYYEKRGWERAIEKLPSVIDTARSGIRPRELMVGIETPSGSKAFRWSTLLSAGLIQDRAGGSPVILILGPDNLSVRSFQIETNSTFVRRTTTKDAIMVDLETSSDWNFAGCAIAGPLRGRCLARVQAKKDYWFDWQNYHPGTSP